MPKKRVGVSLRKSSAPETSTNTSDAASPQSDVRELAPQPSLVESAVLIAPRNAEDAASVEAFVNGAALAIEQVASTIPTAKLEELRRRGPEGYRELTIYLPDALAERLSVHCLEHNVDLSRLIAAALEQYLRGESPAAASVKSERALRAVARELLADIAAWVVDAWNTRRRQWPARAPSAASS
ncbi:MAG: hypothetical protein ABW217_22230 [Polyangiaceae bacterium]